MHSSVFLSPLLARSSLLGVSSHQWFHQKSEILGVAAPVQCEIKSSLIAADELQPKLAEKSSLLQHFWLCYFYCVIFIVLF